MSEFLAFLQIGFQHITDLAGYDHILFILALCAIYRPKDWKKILILVTFFTLGHSITLALAALNFVSYSITLIEFLIPLSIFITCITNIFSKNSNHPILHYGMAIFFGLIHGLGFSSYLRTLMADSSSIIKQLFAFNLGLELGQLLIVVLFMIITFFLLKFTKIKAIYYTYLISIIIGVFAINLMIDKWVF